MEKYRDFLLDETMTQEEKADFLCFSRQEVSNLILALKTQDKLKEEVCKLTCEDVQEDDTSFTEENLEYDKISPTHYTEISKAPEEEQLEIAKKVVDGGLTVKQTQLLIKEIKEEKIKVSSFGSNVEWTDYGINISYGCIHDCSYCYGKLMNQRMKWVDNWTEPKIRDIDLEDLSKKLERLEAGTFMFCSVTDPYQPINAESWTREVLEVLLNSKHHIIILTKSALVEKDLEFISQFDNVELGFTIICLDDKENKIYEPHSSLPTERIRVLKKAHELGIKTLVSVEPWIIGHTHPLEIIDLIKNEVDRWIIGIYNYAGAELEDYRPYVSELIDYLIKNELKFRLKAELTRVLKSYPVLSKNDYEKSARQQVGRK